MEEREEKGRKWGGRKSEIRKRIGGRERGDAGWRKGERGKRDEVGGER